MNEKIIKDSFEQAEGIDTITFEVFPQFVNTQNWWNKRQVFNGVSLEIRKSKYKNFYYCHIQAEVLNQNRNIRGQVKGIVACLYLGHFIDFKCMDANPYALIFYRVDKLIQLEGIDFHFDFKAEDIKFPQENMPFLTTMYSKDHKKRKSLWIIYDRRKYLHKVNQIKSELIDNMPYPMRVEIRLHRSNCKYIHIDNLNGNYYQVLFLYLDYIAKSWRKHSASLCKIPIVSSNRLFTWIQLLAVSGISITLKKELRTIPKLSSPLNKIQENNEDISDKENITQENNKDIQSLPNMNNKKEDVYTLSLF